MSDRTIEFIAIVMTASFTFTAMVFSIVMIMSCAGLPTGLAVCLACAGLLMEIPWEKGSKNGKSD